MQNLIIRKWRFFYLLILLLFPAEFLIAAKIDNTFKTQQYIEFSPGSGSFVLASGGSVAPLIVADDDEPGVHRVVSHLQNDLFLVTGVKPEIEKGNFSAAKNAVIIGTLGKSSLIDQMVASGKINVSDVKDRWELSLIQVVDNPLPGIDKGLVIVGSDKRGTIFGMFDLSAQIGVSPWYWWADVPVESKTELYIKAGRYNLGEPKVQYRGIFLNDEEPALGGWVRETFGGFNADFYACVYELILRMKGNFLWPAMWGKAHADDDPMNPVLADEYGVVISYTHHEPMMRAHVEWQRYGEGPWDYTENKEKLEEFWTEGVTRNLGYESFITIGMRGDGDMAMSADRNIDLLTEIIENQRVIIEQVTDLPATKVPQMWALYKEVQEYYDSGMRVPDDIMLLYCDDNWGNIRRMPGDEERAREGGMGMYYHFDYVGGPRNYKWINTNPLPKVWEQNKLTYEYGVNKIWVVNVGDLKPVEYPIQFYLDLAWDPDRFEANDLNDYAIAWARQQFGEEYAEDIAYFMSHYGKINGRRTPEMIDWTSFSLHNYREFERLSEEYNNLTAKAAKVYDLIPESYRDAYYQLLMYPIEAAANLYNLYYATARNHSYANQGRVSANAMADSVRYFFKKDSLMTVHFHTELADGKWNHMMAQTRIGYRYWQEPRFNFIPPTQRVDALIGAHPEIQLEGQTEVYSLDEAYLPEFDSFNKPSYFIELFNKGDESYKYKLKSKQKWVKFSSAKGTINDQKRIYVSIDWDSAPLGLNNGLITMKLGKQKMDVKLSVWNPSESQKADIKGHIETNGYISVEASNFSRLTDTKDIKWVVVPDIGRTLDGVLAQPYMVEEQEAGKGPSIEYDLYVRTPGTVKVHAYFSPTLNYPGDEGLHYAMSFNDDKPVVVNAHADESNYEWEQMVGNSIMLRTSEHNIGEAGLQTLKYHMVSPGLVLQKIVIDTGGLKTTYLGPEESFKK